MLANKARETALEIQKSVLWAKRKTSSIQWHCVSAPLWAGESGGGDGPDHAGLSGSLASWLAILWPAMSEQSTGLFLLGAETRKEIL